MDGNECGWVEEFLTYHHYNANPSTNERQILSQIRTLVAHYGTVSKMCGLDCVLEEIILVYYIYSNAHMYHACTTLCGLHAYKCTTFVSVDCTSICEQTTHS